MKSAVYEGGGAPTQRDPLLDALRGFALLHMIAYHAVWDLVNLRGMKLSWFEGTPGFLWQQMICWSFILLSGFCWNLGRCPVRRGIVLFTAGLAVTAATEFVLPEAPIWWGILTFLGAASAVTVLLHPLLRRCPPWMGLGASGGLFFLLRHVENGLVAGRDVMPRWLYQGHLGAFWGFPAPEFTSTDYFPILPWIFLYESGYFLFFIRRRQARPHALSRAVPVLGWMGRRSLWIYLLHQPLLFGALLAAGQLG